MTPEVAMQWVAVILFAGAGAASIGLIVAIVWRIIKD